MKHLCVHKLCQNPCYKFWGEINIKIQNILISHETAFTFTQYLVWNENGVTDNSRDQSDHPTLHPRFFFFFFFGLEGGKVLIFLQLKSTILGGGS